MKPRNRILIRPLEADDVSTILEVISGCRREYGLEGRVQSIIEPTDYAIFDLYQRDRSRYFVATEDDGVVGGGGIAPLIGADPRTCELQRMYLRPPHRHLGVGRAILAACIEQAKQFGFERCYAETISEMITALAFYQCAGFRRLDAPVGRTAHGHNDCWMMLDLAGWYCAQESWPM